MSSKIAVCSGHADPKTRADDFEYVGWTSFNMVAEQVVRTGLRTTERGSRRSRMRRWIPKKDCTEQKDHEHDFETVAPTSGLKSQHGPLDRGAFFEEGFEEENHEENSNVFENTEFDKNKGLERLRRRRRKRRTQGLPRKQETEERPGKNNFETTLEKDNYEDND